MTDEFEQRLAERLERLAEHAPTTVRSRPAATTQPQRTPSKQRAVWIAALAAFIAAVTIAATQLSSNRANHPNSPSGPATTNIDAAARAYADAFLRGSAAEINAVISASCSPMTDAALASIRSTVETRNHIALSAVHIVSVEPRSVVGSRGQATVHTDLPAQVEGNDNWLTYAVEDGRFKVTDCGRLPLGNAGSSAPSTATGATGATQQLPPVLYTATGDNGAVHWEYQDRGPVACLTLTGASVDPAGACGPPPAALSTSNGPPPPTFGTLAVSIIDQTFVATWAAPNAMSLTIRTADGATTTSTPATSSDARGTLFFAVLPAPRKVVTDAELANATQVTYTVRYADGSIKEQQTNLPQLAY